MDEKHVRLSVIGFAILLIALVGGTYAFFNYTRTGAANTIRTGRIYFNTTQGEELTLTNVFPMKSSEAGSANLDFVTVGIVGDTTYADGEEFEITLTGLNNTVNGKKIPINYIATYTAATGGSIGEASGTYFTSRDDKDANIYKLNATGEVVDGKQVLTGYIKNGATGISGTLSIKAYIDADRIAISDTYYENAPTPSPTASPLASPNDEYGTTTEWVDGRVVLTTEEWNSLASTPISFKIKAKSNEGIWTSPQIESCIGCKFMYTTSNIYTVWNTTNHTPTVITTGLNDNYLKVTGDSGKNYFLGVRLDTNNQIVDAYACGLRENIPFCIESKVDGSAYSVNKALLQGEELWNNTCDVEGSGGFEEITCTTQSSLFTDSAVLADTDDFIYVGINHQSNYCFVDYGSMRCEQ